MNLIAVVLGLLMQIGIPFPGPGGAGGAVPVVFVQSKGRSQAAGGNDSGIVPDSNVTSGHFLTLICATWTGDSVATPPVPTDTLANTWTLCTGCNSGANASNFNSRSWTFTATASSTGTDSLIKCNMSANDNRDEGFLEYGGATALDSGATNFSNNNSSTTGVTHSVTSTVTDTLITYTFVAASPSSTLTTPTGFTTELTLTSVSGNTFKVYDKSAVAPGAQSVANVGTGTTPLHSGLLGIHP
jgi:hypothetical protein